MDSKQSAEFRSVLKEKLDQPHLRDLTPEEQAGFFAVEIWPNLAK